MSVEIGTFTLDELVLFAPANDGGGTFGRGSKTFSRSLPLPTLCLVWGPALRVSFCSIRLCVMSFTCCTSPETTSFISDMYHFLDGFSTATALFSTFLFATSTFLLRGKQELRVTGIDTPNGFPIVAG